MIFSLYQLYLRPYSFESDFSRIGIARVSSRVETVKFKEKNSFSWKDAREGLGLAVGDRIYTHDSSLTQIDFDKGPRVSMDPNTLLEIKEAGDSLGLKLQSGNVSTLFRNSTDHITLLLGKRRFILKATKAGGRLNISKEKGSSSTKLTILKGELSIQEVDSSEKEDAALTKTKTFKKASIRLLETRSLNQAQVTRHPLSFEQEIPRNVRNFPSVALPLSWSGLKGPYQVTLTKPNSKESRVITKAATLKITPKLMGLYTYQVKTIDTKEESPQLSFFFKPYEKPSFDLSNNRLQLSTKKEMTINVSIEKRPYLQKIVLKKQTGEILKEWPMDFKEGPSASNQKLSLSLAPDEKYTPGTYDLVLRPIEKASSDYLVIKKLELIKPQELLAPVISKANNLKIYTYTQNTTTQLAWEPSATIDEGEGSAKRYDIEIRQGTNEKSVVSFTKTYTLPIQAKSATIKWRVRQVLPNDKSDWSPWQSISVINNKRLVQFPKSGTEVFLDRPNQLVDFKWLTADGKSYSFELATDNKFKEKLVQKQTKASKIQIPIGAKGLYYWRVKLINQDGSEAIKLGAPLEIKITPSPAPKPLKLQEKLELEISPKTTQTSIFTVFFKSLLNTLIPNAKASTSEGAATLTWPSNPLAKTYILRIYSKKEASVPLLEVEADKNTYEWTNARPGIFYWEVAIKDHWERIGAPSNRSQLILKMTQIKQQKKERSVISLVSPAHRAVLEGKQQTFHFKTTGSSLNSLLRLQFSKDLNFSRPIVDLEIKSEKVNIGRQGLAKKVEEFEKRPSSELNLYWRIVAPKTKTKSFRRSFSWKQVKRKGLNKKLSQVKTEKNKKIINQVFQELTSTTLKQESNAFNLEASGIFVNSLGWQGDLSSLAPMRLRIKAGTAKAFKKYRYNQIQTDLLYATSFFKKSGYTISLGPRLALQTFFTEEAVNILKEEQKLSAMMALSLEKKVLENYKLQASVAYGNALHYQMRIERKIGLVFERAMRLGLIYEKLSFEKEALEIGRQSIGLSWSLALSP